MEKNFAKNGNKKQKMEKEKKQTLFFMMVLKLPLNIQMELAK